VKKLLFVCAIGSAELVIASSYGARPALARVDKPVCRWSISAACAAWRNGGIYTRGGVTHQAVKRNGRYIVHVYANGTRVK
jgi:hypothetical protein